MTSKKVNMKELRQLVRGIVKESVKTTVKPKTAKPLTLREFKLLVRKMVKESLQEGQGDDGSVKRAIMNFITDKFVNNKAVTPEEAMEDVGLTDPEYQKESWARQFRVVYDDWKMHRDERLKAKLDDVMPEDWADEPARQQYDLLVQHARTVPGALEVWKSLRERWDADKKREDSPEFEAATQGHS